MYQIKDVDYSSGKIIFHFLDVDMEYKINYIGENIYSFVNTKYHYIDVNTNNVIVIDDDVSTRRIFINDSDNNLYKKATQFEFDRWMAKEFPSSENALIYNTIIQKIQTIKQYTDDSSDDEDPYYRGNIDDFVKKARESNN